MGVLNIFSVGLSRWTFSTRKTIFFCINTSMLLLNVILLALCTHYHVLDIFSVGLSRCPPGFGLSQAE